MNGNILAAIGVSFVVTAASVPMFGWVTRCGWALPLAIAMAYAVARFAGNRQNHVIGLVGVVALQIVTLVKDSSTGGLGALALSLPLTAVFYGIGLFVQTRAAKQPAGCTVISSRSNTTKPSARVRMRLKLPSALCCVAAASPSSVRTSASLASRRKITRS